MADDEHAQRDELDAALSAHLRAGRPAPGEPSANAPSDNEILRYVDGVMDDAERTTFEAHVSEHPEVVDRIAVVAGALGETGFAALKPTQDAGLRAARFVFQLSRGALAFLRGSSLPLSLEPALAVRSQAPPEPPHFFEVVTHLSSEGGESGDIEARLAIEATQAEAVDVQIAITRQGAPLDGVRVKLLRDGRPIDSAPADHGRCTFTSLRAARYELEIRKGGTEVGRMTLDIRDDRSL
jgi:hypothetical protein